MAITQVITSIAPAANPATMDRTTFSTTAAANVLAISAMTTELNTWAGQVNVIAGVAVGDMATGINAATAKTTPVDADLLCLTDSAAAFVLKKFTWANVKATLGSTFAALAGSASQAFSATTAAAGTNTTQVATTAFVFGMRTKIIVSTRLLSAASGNVSYTGAGFRPRKVTVYASISGTLAQSTALGNAASAVCRYTEPTNPAGLIVDYIVIIKEYATPTNYQTAIQVSLDADGITLAWTKAGAGTASVDLAFFFEE